MVQRSVRRRFERSGKSSAPEAREPRADRLFRNATLDRTLTADLAHQQAVESRVPAQGSAGHRPVIGSGSLKAGQLAGEVVVVTGGAHGIGLEAARSLLWLGATVVIADLDAEAGRRAAQALPGACFHETDVSVASSVRALADALGDRFGHVDAVVNNAAFAPVGASVTETPLEEWERSYTVNLRGPVLLAKAFLPAMLERRHGAFVCVSSTGGPYLGAYETLKAAQVALAATLDAELEGSGVHVFTIGPGLVPTETATAAVALLAPRLGTTVEDFWAANRAVVLSVEAAGAGFAAAVALADRYAGQEISSSQALLDAGCELAPDSSPAPLEARPELAGAAALPMCRQVEERLRGQAEEWRARSFFERQWMFRDFRQRVGVPVEGCVERLHALQRALEVGDATAAAAELSMLNRLAGFYAHMAELARSYARDPRQREEQAALVSGWESDVRQLTALLGGSP